MIVPLYLSFFFLLLFSVASSLILFTFNFSKILYPQGNARVEKSGEIAKSRGGRDYVLELPPDADSEGGR